MADSPRHEPPADGPDHLGSPAWLEATGGVLTRRQRARLVGAAYRQLPKHVVHRARAKWWWRNRPSKGEIDFATDRRPDSKFAEAAREMCHDLLSPAMVNHSWRAWVFGSALAERDGVDLDGELFFAAAMLHDIGLAKPSFEECFTGAGVNRARDLGAKFNRPDSDIAIVASAISHHITPGITADRSGVHGLYIQQGTVLDLGGTRAIHLPIDFVRDACDTWPHLGVKREAGARWRAEAAMVKHGRAHLLERWACFSLAVRFAPLPP